MWPGVCAPSMTLQAPRLRASAIRLSTGNSSAVGEVMWLRNRTFVRSVNPAATASWNCCALVSGSGTVTTTTLAPVLRLT